MAVQLLSQLCGQDRFNVCNVNHQTETSDLLGGWKPKSAFEMMQSLYEEFDKCFTQTSMRNATGVI